MQKKFLFGTILSFSLAALISAPVLAYADSSIGSTFGILQEEKYDNLDEDPVLSGGEARFLYNEGGDGQQLSAVFCSSDGAVIVVDGGRGEDTEHLLQVISGFGGHVDAWLITHPHADHAGALIKILSEKRDDISIGGIYYHFMDDDWYDAFDPDEAAVPGTLRALFSELDQSILHPDIARGDEFFLSDALSFRVLNDPVATTGIFAGNASGIMYDIDIDNKHFIMLGDMSSDAGDALMADGVLDGIVCDYCQISHHGQTGVSDEFYAALDPTDCIWPTNEYIYLAKGSRESGLYTTDTKLAISKLRVRHNYVTLGRDVIIR